MTSPDGIAIAIGQVWQDNDKRTNGRRVRVVGMTIDKAHVATLLADGTLSKRSSWLTAGRMRANWSNGFTLVEHPDGRPA